ncbi:Crp/Fnr family transcriptional regulator [Niveibacterium sp. 24ML]|uniref:Crp/Fnr family transcriptional regulator n=1 Tax=Niveibacterium sp. 24ML TaxID=2985512 RepID=UPI00226FE617|nr:Crp/Fnr family transcriptional regulator [Niveibacterium sp. 24ML]MCX9155329.1 Crp/Fnr family transcriptional regulator [Niveibacterium sp. 24ML]
MPTHCKEGLQPSPRLRARGVPRGEVIYEVGATGQTWRLISGIVRLDRDDASGPQFASLALAGDLLGSELLLHDCYVFRATALTTCRIEPWLPPPAEQGYRPLLERLTALEARAADLLALRTGSPLDRVSRLLRLLAGGDLSARATRIALPRLRDMAEMTNLAGETVSRAFSELRRQGVLTRDGHRRASVSSMVAALDPAVPLQEAARR